MKKWGLILAMGLIIGMTGCFGDDGKDVFETAQLEELQHNTAHARQLYQDLIEKHPDSSYAKTAQERLKKLNPEKTEQKPE